MRRSAVRTFAGSALSIGMLLAIGWSCTFLMTGCIARAESSRTASPPTGTRQAARFSAGTIPSENTTAVSRLTASPAESLFFTRTDVLEAFALIIDRPRAEQYTSMWAVVFHQCMTGDAITALPAVYKVRLKPIASPPCVEADAPQFERFVGDGIGVHLLRFTDVLLTLVAASNPEARARFDRLKVRYAKGSIDDPADWTRIIAYLKGQDSPVIR